MQSKFDIFLKGETVNLAAVTETLVDDTNWYRWFNDEKNMEFMNKHRFPSTVESQKRFVRESLINNSSTLPLAIIHKESDIMIGIVSLTSIDFINRSCSISGFIGEVQYQKLTYFIEANKLIMKHAFQELNMNKLWGGSINNDVINLFCRILGFQKEGVKRQEVYKNGTYKDAIFMSLLRQEFEERRSANEV